MLDPARLKERMTSAGLSQSALGRRVGVSQATIYKLLTGQTYGSKHLHRIARALGTTPAYLEGEIDDPSEGALPPAPAGPIVITMGVVLPPERALVAMFQALLAGIDPQASEDERALLLARRLPIGLSQLRDLLPDEVTPARELAEAVAGVATPARQRPR